MRAAPVVYLFGEESFLVDRELRSIESEVFPHGNRDLNRDLFEAPASTPGKVITAARTLPFLGDRRLVVLRNAHLWNAEAWQSVLPYLEKPNPSTCLVFVATQLDRRTRAGKAMEKLARVVECRRPAERELYGWAERMAAEAGLKLSSAVTHALVLRVGSDLQVLWSELEKLRAFAAGGQVSAEDVDALVSESRGTTVFALCDALGQRHLEKALRSLVRLLQDGEPPVRLLYMIARHFRHLWTACELLGHSARPDPRKAASALGVPPFAAEALLKQARGWEEAHLKEALRSLLEADIALKSGGGREVLEGLVLGLCAGPKRKAPLSGRTSPHRDASR